MKAENEISPNADSITGTSPRSSYIVFLVAGLALPGKQPVIYGNRLFSHS